MHKGLDPHYPLCAVWLQGFDEPSIDALLLARPTKSTGLYTQVHAAH
jgi:superfamily II DNA or RNA helicase